ncbi:YceD family protein [Streptomyces sp. H10-C2]|uniref:YceD family protein n=1 Tax=unclassified Streptomyces TaxID=2593676 RepID=UPI0024B9C515|nr:MULTISPECIES: YceD family protein [unclassified Streptomyces]MDJ0341698.1 YceD family protein [Streptomyces sp. PH10-H1]MDJ0368994.1 YceD family protein [Streptomyces sp. H10-C2]
MKEEALKTPRLDHRDPLVFDTHELGRRPGSMRKVSRSVPAPKDLGIEVITVPENAPVQLELRLESVMEGVLVTGTVRAPLTGECVRCLEPFERKLDAEFQEMYSYPDADTRTARKDEAGDDAEEEALFLEDDLFDLEPALRDAVVLALPLQPVCQEDCPGLCSECGERLADDPDHHHEVADIRWAALQEFKKSGADQGADENQEK